MKALSKEWAESKLPNEDGQEIGAGCPASDLFVLDELAPGSVIQHGDLMLVIPGDPRSLASMDNGKLMGVRVAGCEVKKSGAWFRPRWTNGQHQATASTKR